MLPEPAPESVGFLRRGGGGFLMRRGLRVVADPGAEDELRQLRRLVRFAHAEIAAQDRARHRRLLLDRLHHPPLDDLRIDRRPFLGPVEPRQLVERDPLHPLGALLAEPGLRLLEELLAIEELVDVGSERVEGVHDRPLDRLLFLGAERLLERLDGLGVAQLAEPFGGRGPNRLPAVAERDEDLFRFPLNGGEAVLSERPPRLRFADREVPQERHELGRQLRKHRQDLERVLLDRVDPVGLHAA